MHSTNVQAAITLLKLIKATLGRVEHVEVPYLSLSDSLNAESKFILFKLDGLLLVGSCWIVVVTQY